MSAAIDWNGQSYNMIYLSDRADFVGNNYACAAEDVSKSSSGPAESTCGPWQMSEWGGFPAGRRRLAAAACVPEWRERSRASSLASPESS